MLSPNTDLTLGREDQPVLVGQASAAGVKAYNDDFHGAVVPDGSARTLKGLAFAIADGISSSQYGAVAAQTAIRSLLTDYYATPDAWTVKTSVSRVLGATNNWLNAQSSFKGVYDPDHGYVCTLATLIIKGQTAHLFNIGDSRIWRLSGDSLEPLTSDHQVTLGDGQVVLSRALGVEDSVEIDYRKERLANGDVFLLTTDGLHGFWNEKAVAARLASLTENDDLDALAEEILDEALANGSDDNLTLQIVRINHLQGLDDVSFSGDIDLKPLADRLAVGQVIDGITILREIHSNHRSEIFIGRLETGRTLCVKIPATEVLEDKKALNRFMIEEWIARQIHNPHVLSAPDLGDRRSGLYVATDFVEGQTLRQWMHDNPERSFEDIRIILEQVVKGLRAFHRKEMLHQDLRPENIMIGPDLHVTIIDFGAAYVAGVQEAGPVAQDPEIEGTVQYTAPEYYTAEPVSWRSDQFSLGIIAYELFTGALPYGTQVSQLRKPSDRKRLKYRTANNAKRAIPDWIDDALKRAVHPLPSGRFDALSEFVQALRTPSLHYLAREQKPLLDRTPVEVWRLATGILALICLVQGMLLFEQFQ
ncbi:bifunctional protein-serine/threonine kinase/phosphatase [uncultured Cohaesibacter sp.]|uniref:bifunctional protein-serine/threonine kinase/phosphatase n=1 Tax=uncultured Cohaesibacter sp. TaxID=1002546 RepID=UPI0029C680CF|nr:bifunctional protein-serine/threonine kinase/phosphatase [uncultured Cohaesibacter sp.]